MMSGRCMAAVVALWGTVAAAQGPYKYLGYAKNNGEASKTFYIYKDPAGRPILLFPGQYRAGAYHGDMRIGGEQILIFDAKLGSELSRKKPDGGQGKSFLWCKGKQPSFDILTTNKSWTNEDPSDGDLARLYLSIPRKNDKLSLADIESYLSLGGKAPGEAYVIRVDGREPPWMHELLEHWPGAGK